MHDRTLKLIDMDTFQKIKNCNILLIGLGGVGGYAFESFLRSGFCHITVVDQDVFEESNLNRQILATYKTLGRKKVEVAIERARKIHSECEVTPIHKTFIEEDITEKFLSSFDYVIDACDSKNVKIALIKQCNLLKIPIISCMGTANRTHPEFLTIKKLKDTQNDPLAKILRHDLRNNKQALNTFVVCSTELPKKQKDLGTVVMVPMVAGALLASFVLNDIKTKLSTNSNL